MAILSVACYVCYSKKKREIAYGASVLEESCSEVGGATSLEAQIEQSHPEVQVEVQVEVELETTDPEIIVEVGLPRHESLDFQMSGIIVENETLNITDPNEQTNQLNLAADLEVVIDIET